MTVPAFLLPRPSSVLAQVVLVEVPLLRSLMGRAERSPGGLRPLLRRPPPVAVPPRRPQVPVAALASFAADMVAALASAAADKAAAGRVAPGTAGLDMVAALACPDTAGSHTLGI
ncbi:MAG: hypothetical protein WBC71_05420, partial [Salaquimonas sp.]